MRKRIAVYSQTLNFWGGSFQYAKAFTEALGGLDTRRYDVQVWHHADDEWNGLCQKLGFVQHILGEYDFPKAFIPVAQKILARLQSLSEDDVENRQALLAPLKAYTADSMLESFEPHLVVLPQMGNPRYVRRAKHIGVIHDLMHRYETRFPEVCSDSELADRERLFKGMVRRCDAILVDSEIGKHHVLECYPQARKEQIKILPFAAFDEIMSVIPEIPDFALPEKFFFYPAQFWMHKNHVGLVEAIRLLCMQIPDIVIVAAGNIQQNGYPLFAEAVTRHKLEKYFITPGYLPVAQLAWLYRHARGLVMPTYLGPTNIPPMEAMALDCPVAVSRIYGMPEQCGDAAIYFDPGNPHEIAKAMQQLWLDDALCEELVKKGKVRSENYDILKFKERALQIVMDTLYYESLERKTLYKVEKPRLSICIIAYNAERYIDRCLQSLVKQTIKPYEIIFVDDGSTDNTIEIANRYKLDDFPLKIYSLEKNSGVGKARNVAIQHASGDYVWAVDVDDYLEENALAIFQENILKYDSDVIVASMECVTPAGRHLYNFGAPKEYVNINPVEHYELAIFTSGFHQLMAIRRTLIVQNGLAYGENLKCSSDGYFLFNMIWHVETMTLLPDIIYKYVNNEQSVSKQRDITFFEHDIGVYANLLRENFQREQDFQYAAIRILYRIDEFFYEDVKKHLNKFSNNDICKIITYWKNLFSYKKSIVNYIFNNIEKNERKRTLKYVKLLFISLLKQEDNDLTLQFIKSVMDDFK